MNGGGGVEMITPFNDDGLKILSPSFSVDSIGRPVLAALIVLVRSAFCPEIPSPFAFLRFPSVEFGP